MATVKKILVPVDFSEQSLIALDQSYNLAKGYDAEITLLYVIEDDGGFLSKFFADDKSGEIKKNIQNQLDELAAKVHKKSKVKIHTMIARGRVYEKVAEVADMLNAVMIIMGCNGSKSKLKKRFIGSNALRIVRASKQPVITIKGKLHRAGCENIVLPLDLTKETKEKVNKAIEFSKLFGGAAIRVVSVLLSTDEFVINRLTRQLSQVKGHIEKAGIECSAEIIRSKKEEETLSQSILGYAKKVDGDLLMIMTQQEVDFTKYFIGSSAQEIILNSEIPVLSIVPSPKKDTTSSVKPY